MRIGIDVSQLAYSHTGVANYLESLVGELIKNKKHEYVLFFSSLRRTPPVTLLKMAEADNVTLKRAKLPPTALHILWNIIHLTPIENFIGQVDIFITSDWSEPPAKKAKKATILYDLIVYKYPQETAEKIVKVQRRKLAWVKRESGIVLCISEATKKDAIEILKIPEDKLKVIYPGT
jgi:hypothetical protein